MEITLESSNRRLSRDLVSAAMTLTDAEARFLVDTYYQLQDYRIASANQCRSIEQAPERYLQTRIEEIAEQNIAGILDGKEITQEKYKKLVKQEIAKIKENDTLMAILLEEVPEKEPHETLSFFAKNFENNETDIRKALNAYVLSRPIGRWMMSICGIGPVIAAGLLANIDIHKAPTAGHIWNYAGLNPLQEWKKGEKRPWNARLKTLCWLLGESFVKVSNRDNDFYGHIYRERKELELAKNENGEYAEEAAKQLQKKNYSKSTDAYKCYVQGKLPPAHIQSRCKRYAVKLFLSHLQQVWWEMEKGEKPPKPFAIGILGHAHMINPPNYPFAA